jgi:hypothetical protein
MVYNGDVPLRYVSLETKLSFDPMKQNPQKKHGNTHEITIVFRPKT